MKVNPSIFKAYDIRGKYPEEINEEIAYKIGRAFIDFIKKNRPEAKKIDIIIGRDNRLSSPILFKALTQAITNSGANVVSLGVCTTPMLYFASARYKFDDGGIMITASHLPKEYNGFKLVKEAPIPIDFQTGLEEIKEMTIKQKFEVSIAKGKMTRKNILKEYVKFNLKDLNLAKIAPLKVIIDTGNTSTGIIIPEIFKRTKCKIYHLFPKLNGNFPNRPPDCMLRKNLKKLQREVLKRKADLGVAFDGDGDRIVFIDEQGKFISPNIITAFISNILLREKSGAKIIYTVRGSKIIPEVVKKSRGVPVIWEVGHSNIKRKMRKENILFGGEASGHYYCKRHYFSEAPFFVLFKILEELSQTKQSFSELIKPFKKYFYSGEINFKVKEKEKILVKLERKYKKGQISHLDGLRVDFKDWWFNIRSSQTEPLLRLVIEAKTKKILEEKKKELSKLIPSFS